MIKIHYLCIPVSSSGYLQAIDEHLSCFYNEEVWALTFFISPVVNQYDKMLADIKSLVSEKMDTNILVTLVPQKMADGSLVGIEVYEYDGKVLECSTSVVCREDGRAMYSRILKCENYDIMCMEGISSTCFSESIFEQGKTVFERVENLLAAEGFSVNDIVRQWNYIGNITGMKAGRQNYQEFNEVRTSYYQRVQWERGYPAATGIGVDWEGMLVSCIAVKFNQPKDMNIFPIDNSWQIAAHAYSEMVLKKNPLGETATTPKFERAKLVRFADCYICFISGTAAIRGELSSISISAYEQTIQTIENIQHLVSAQNLKIHNCPVVDLYPCNFRVYIKRKEDYAVIRNTVEECFPGVPVIYLLADVCREELLVEIEGIYQTNNRVK